MAVSSYVLVFWCDNVDQLRRFIYSISVLGVFVYLNMCHDNKKKAAKNL